MPANKNRLYIALCPSGIQGDEIKKYHWGFIIGPKKEKNSPVQGTRHHIKNLPAEGYKYGQWIYEPYPLSNVQQSIDLLARILIGKIADEERLLSIIESISVVQHNPEYWCRPWVAAVLRALAEDGKAMGTTELDFARIEPAAREYVGMKTAAGRYRAEYLKYFERQEFSEAKRKKKGAAGIPPLTPPKPMWDMIAGREVFV